MKRLHLLAWLCTMPFALGGAPGIAAEIYKWVDERGVVNYSDQPPMNASAASKLTTIEDRVSVYTPDRALTQAIESRRQQQGDPALSGRVEYLERELEIERRARQYAAAAVAQPAPCPAGNDCYGIGGYPGVYVPVAAPFRKRLVHQAQIKPGTIAGTAVGMDGYIPGYSTSAPAPMKPEPRVSRHSPRLGHAR